MKTVSGKSEAAETADNRHNYGTLEFGQGGGRRRAAVAVAPSCVRPSVRRKERLTPVETFLDCLALASFCRFRFVPFLTFFFLTFLLFRALLTTRIPYWFPTFLSPCVLSLQSLPISSKALLPSSFAQSPSMEHGSWRNTANANEKRGGRREGGGGRSAKQGGHHVRSRLAQGLASSYHRAADGQE